MDLWALFPKAFLGSFSLSYLPWVTVSLFLLIALMALLYSDARLTIIAFLVVNIVLSVYTLLTLGPGMSITVLPGMYLVLLTLSLTWLLKDIVRRQFNPVAAIVVCATFSHSLSWGAWVTALAGS